MYGRKRPDWNTYAMILAQAASTRSEDPYRQVGASALRLDNSVAGLGYNGPPPKIEIDWSDRPGRQQYILHAERNCLNYVEKGECRLIACTVMPCEDCIREIALKGIPLIVYGEVYLKNGEEPMEDIVTRLASSFNIQLAHIPLVNLNIWQGLNS